jgi:hypothetical protein
MELVACRDQRNKIANRAAIKQIPGTQRILNSRQRTPGGVGMTSEFLMGSGETARKK